jgi:hypothetical protein
MKDTKRAGAAPPSERSTPTNATDPDVGRAIANALTTLDYVNPRMEAERKRTLLPRLEQLGTDLSNAVKDGRWQAARAARTELRRVLGELQTPAPEW